MQRVRRQLTYANVMATLAVLIAVAGGSTAIALSNKAPKNSVTSKSIVNGNVTARDVGTIKNVSAQVQLNDAVAGDGNYTPATAVANCPAGTRAVSGGGGAGATNRTAIVSSAKSGQSAWSVTAASDQGPPPITVVASASCLLRTPGSPQG